MNKTKNLLLSYPLSALCIALIWILCFCTPPHTPLDNVPFMDKWTHITMYGVTCSVMWLETIFRRKNTVPSIRRMLLFVWLCPVLMSGLIEILQAYCTGGRRSGDWFDFLANSLGATLGFAIGYIIYRWKRK